MLSLLTRDDIQGPTPEDRVVIHRLGRVASLAYWVEVRDRHDLDQTLMREVAVMDTRRQSTLHPRIVARMVHCIRALTHLPSEELEFLLHRELKPRRRPQCGSTSS